MNFNNSKDIAFIICPLVRANSSRIKVQCIATPNDALFNDAYNILEISGMRKSFFQNKMNYVIDTILSLEHCFVATHDFFELRSTFPEEAYWNGGGACKSCPASLSYEIVKAFESIGGSGLGPSALFHIDITDIWKEISPLLQQNNPSDSILEAKIQRRDTLADAPDYTGPRDPKIDAEVEEMIASHMALAKQKAMQDPKT